MFSVAPLKMCQDEVILKNTSEYYR